MSKKIVQYNFPNMNHDDSLLKVLEFHEKANQTIKQYPEVTDFEVNQLRLRLLIEELEELDEALGKENETKVFDALLDLQYVLDGAFISLGFWRYKNAGFAEVHRSNMTKDFPTMHEIFHGKVQKGAKYQPPNLEKILNYEKA
jgi:predicted HAD superfamily Cof-like phosphohydrolase